jgi:hypothetical protein
VTTRPFSILLLPAAGAESERHYRSSVERDVDPTRLDAWFEPEVAADIASRVGDTPAAWGLRDNTRALAGSGVQPISWNRIDVGTLALFSNDEEYFARATTASRPPGFRLPGRNCPRSARAGERGAYEVGVLSRESTHGFTAKRTQTITRAVEGPLRADRDRTCISSRSRRGRGHFGERPRASGQGASPSTSLDVTAGAQSHSGPGPGDGCCCRGRTARQADCLAHPTS